MIGRRRFALPPRTSILAKALIGIKVLNGHFGPIYEMLEVGGLKMGESVV